jgi:hypothetical protein
MSAANKEDIVEDPYAVSSSDDEDAIQSDEDLDLLPGVYLDAPVIQKQIVPCSFKDCKGDALKRHARNKIKWKDGAFCFQCRIKRLAAPPVTVKKEYPTANQDWQEAEFQEDMKEHRTKEKEQSEVEQQKRVLEEFNLETFELITVKKTCRSRSNSI